MSVQYPLKSAAALFFLFASLFASSPVYALQVPEKPSAHVNDYASLLSDGARSSIENTLSDFERSTSTQIAVAIFPALEGEALEDFSIRLAEKWKIGSKQNNNGVILLIFRDDHEVRIEVGYGLEGALPDAVADQIIRHEIVPAFREGDYDKGISDAVGAIIRATTGEYHSSPAPQDPVKKYAWIIYIILIFFIILPYIAYAMVVIACSMIFGMPVGLFIGIAISIFLVALRQLFVMANGGSTYSRRGQRWGGGGFTGGGFSGGGGFGGGSFGGGGGSFGGGGASGRW